MDSVEVEGGSIDEAIEGALKQLGATRDKVEIEILSNAARGIFGLGSRKARVRATVRKPIDAEPVQSATDRPLTARPETRLPEGRSQPTARQRQMPERAVVMDSPGAEHARAVLQRIVDLIGVEAEVLVKEEEGRLLLDLTGDSSGVLIGRRGQTLDALEYMLNRIVSRDEGASTHILVDSHNYRARRREALEGLARRMAEQAKRKRKAVTLNPMSPRDRRIVHVLLQEDPALATKSSGKGYFRRLIIIPAGAPRPRLDPDDSD
jgi:spoIIIJ-associated protein